MSIFDIFRSATDKIHSASMDLEKRAHEFRRKTEVRLEVFTALSDLRRDVDFEEIILKSALRHAKLQVEIDAKGPEFRKLFEDTRQAMDAYESDDKADSSDRSVPSFEQPGFHPDEAVLSAIQSEVERLRSRRESFLSDMRSKLSENKSLRSHFRWYLAQSHGERYLEDLDPASEWTSLPATIPQAD